MKSHDVASKVVDNTDGRGASMGDTHAAALDPNTDKVEVYAVWAVRHLVDIARHGRCRHLTR